MSICKIYAINKGNLYPEVDCDQVKAIYGDESLDEYAFREYVGFYLAEENGETASPLQGPLQCYCDDLADEYGQFNILNMTLSSADGSETY